MARRRWAVELPFWFRGLVVTRPASWATRGCHGLLFRHDAKKCRKRRKIHDFYRNLAKIIEKVVSDPYYEAMGLINGGIRGMYDPAWGLNDFVSWPTGGSRMALLVKVLFLAFNGLL